jgi:uncharacterized membrane protein YgdD (TMEM256/DUF423 family)
MDAYLARVDAGMAHIGRVSVTSQFPKWKGDRDAADELFRGSMQSLYLTGMFGDLPVKAQAHPGMQDRMWAAMPTMDRAAEGMTSFLSSRTPQDLRTVQAALRNPDVGRTIITSIDTHAANIGVSAQRRAQSQVMMGQVEWRLRSQPPALVVREYLDKVEKLSETDVAAEARQRLAIAQLGDEVLWQGAAQGPKNGAVRQGGRIMGLGIVVFLGSALLTAVGATPFVFVATVGALMFIIGFLVFLVGLGSPADPATP